jgi:hypothetical protein
MKIRDRGDFPSGISSSSSDSASTSRVGWAGAGRVLGRQSGSVWVKQWGLDCAGLQVNKGFWAKENPF